LSRIAHHGPPHYAKCIQFAVTFSLLGFNIPLSNLFSSTLSLYSTLGMKIFTPFTTEG